MFRPLMAQPCMGGVGRGRLAERFRIIARISLLDPTWVALQVATTWNSMLEWIWVVPLGPPLRLFAGSSLASTAGCPQRSSFGGSFTL